MPVERVDIVELKDAYIVCRTLGHAWDDNPQGKFNANIAAKSMGVLILRCTRCSTERVDYIGKDMTVETRTYSYPEYYNTIVGQGTRPNLRGEMLRRSLLIRSSGRRRKLRSVS